VVVLRVDGDEVGVMLVVADVQFVLVRQLVLCRVDHEALSSSSSSGGRGGGCGRMRRPRNSVGGRGRGGSRHVRVV
jgi:hypothetical protein